MAEPETSALFHPVIAPFLTGLAVHLVYNRFTPVTLAHILSTLFLPPVLLSSLAHLPILSTVFIYFITLITSVILYRLSPLHPLAKYPGPLLARVTRFYQVFYTSKGKQHLHHQRLFAQYGDYVRTGPNHIAIQDANAMNPIHSARNRWDKGPNYNILRQHPKEPGSLFMLMNQADHAPRRIIWDRAFSTASLKTYLPTMHSRVHELTSQLTAVSRGGQVVDIAAWLNYFAVDFMGDFVWGGEFAFMAGKGHDPENGDFMKVLQEGNVALELLVAVPWARVIAQALPDKGFAMLKSHAKKIMLRRRTEGAKGGSRDLMYFLLNEDGQGTHAPFDDDTLEYEAVLAMVAGSDTTSTAMANSVFYLMENPKYYARLRAELDEAAEKSEITSVEDHLDVHVLATLPFLNAVIQETIRLRPAVPSGVHRTPPAGSGGEVLSGHFIPEGTNVQVPTYAVHHDPRWFSPHTDDFWPERFLPDEGPKIAAQEGQEFILDRAAYTPWSIGPGKCAGKALALQEMQLVLSALVRQFDIKFAPSYRPQKWWEDMNDYFVFVNGKLNVVIEERKQK